MRKLAVVPLLFFVFNAFGQYDQLLGKDVPLKERIYVGGGFGLGFSAKSGYVALSPNIGYRITERGSVGVSIMYQYARQELYIQSLMISRTFELNHWGGGIFTRYKVYGPAFVSAEYEYIDFEFVTQNLSTVRRGYSSVLVGGGLAQPITRNVSFIISALYNLTYSSNDGGPYSSPWNIRVGISAGF